MTNRCTVVHHCWYTPRYAQRRTVFSATHDEFGKVEKRSSSWPPATQNSCIRASIPADGRGFDNEWPVTIPQIIYSSETRNTLDCHQSNYSSRIVFFPHTYWIWPNWKQRHSIRPPRKPHRRTKHEVDRVTPRGDMAVWNFPKCEVGRRSVLNIYFFLHWSYILLFATLGT